MLQDKSRLCVDFDATVRVLVFLSPIAPPRRNAIPSCDIRARRDDGSLPILIEFIVVGPPGIEGAVRVADVLILCPRTDRSSGIANSTRPDLLADGKR